MERTSDSGQQQQSMERECKRQMGSYSLLCSYDSLLSFLFFFLSKSVLHEFSQLMQTGLSREQLRICIDLIQNGEDPKAIAVCAPPTKTILQRHID